MTRLVNIVRRFIKNKKIVFVAIAALLLIIYLVWQKTAKGESKPQAQTAQVERGTIISSVTASGKILTSNITDVTTQASGIVKTVYVADGDYVEKGAKIAEIDLDLNGQQAQTQAYSSYLSAKNNLAQAQTTAYSLQADMFSKWDTFKELAESSTYEDVTSANRNLPEFHIAEKEWLAAESKYKNQQQVITQAQTAVNSAWLTYLETQETIMAPVSGTLTSLSIATGMQLGSALTTTGSRTTQRVAAILSEGKKVASFNISEIDVSKIEISQKATITLDSITDKTFTGEVVSVDRIGTTTNNVTTYPVIVRFDTSSNQILPNMKATANITVDRKSDVLIVSTSAIKGQRDETFVVVLRDGRQQNIPVEVGISSDNQVEIVSGLTEGDTVVTGTVTTTSSARSQGGGGFFPLPGGRGFH